MEGGEGGKEGKMEVGGWEKARRGRGKKGRKDRGRSGGTRGEMNKCSHIMHNRDTLETRAPENDIDIT